MADVSKSEKGDTSLNKNKLHRGDKYVIISLMPLNFMDGLSAKKIMDGEKNNVKLNEKESSEISSLF